MRTVRIAMWSGPRNISTALMRSWGNRADTVVIDEPFYAFYLKQTGKPHPGAAEIISHCETDVGRIVAGLVEDLPAGKTIFYQKHMTHHLLPEIDHGWLNDVINCFLIREPAEVITSYLRKNDEPALEDLGFVQQVELFHSARKQTGSVPPVIDAADVLQNPKKILERLCHAIGVPFDQAMLAWPAGLRDTDGIWAKYWYAEVAKSTGFQPYHPKTDTVPTRLMGVYAECRRCYDELYEHRFH